jgi:hypothetical protein
VATLPIFLVVVLHLKFLEPLKTFSDFAGAILFLGCAFFGFMTLFNLPSNLVLTELLLGLLIFLAVLYWGFFYAAPFKHLRDLIKWAYNGLVLGAIIGVIPALERVWQNNGAFVAVLLVDPVLLILALLIPYSLDNVYRKWRGLPPSSANLDTLPSVQGLPFPLDGDKTWKAQGSLSRQELLEYSPYQILVNVQPSDFDNRDGYWDKAVISPSTTPDDESIKFETFLKNGTRVGSWQYGKEDCDPLMQVVDQNGKIVCEGSLGRSQVFVLEMARRYRQDISGNYASSLWGWFKLFEEQNIPDGAQALRFAPLTIWATTQSTDFNNDPIERLEPSELSLEGQRFVLGNSVWTLNPDAPAEVRQGWRSPKYSNNRLIFKANSITQAEQFVLGLYADYRLRMMSFADDSGRFWDRDQPRWGILNSSPIRVKLEWEYPIRNTVYTFYEEEWDEHGIKIASASETRAAPSKIRLFLGSGLLIEFQTIEQAEAFILERHANLHSEISKTWTW